MVTVESTTLTFQEGKSNKAYTAAIVKEAEGVFDVIAEYGRRGGTMKSETKAKGVTYAVASPTYDKLVKSKIAKGYKLANGGSAAAVAAISERDGRDSGIQVQLLNEVSDERLEELLEDDAWVMQEKIDGHRRVVIVRDGEVHGVNRKGLYVPLPPAIVVESLAIFEDAIIDGELVGDTYYAFDALWMNGIDLKEDDFDTRHACLADAIAEYERARERDYESFRLVHGVRGSVQKVLLLEHLRSRGAEGVVFRKLDAPYTAGRPNSGGTAIKFKFWKTASVMVFKHNATHSVSFAVCDGGKLVEVGNVTIPQTIELPALASVIEVRYRHANRGGALQEPIYEGGRDDLEWKDCTIAQLAFKGEAQPA